MTLMTVNALIASIICLVAIGLITSMNGITPHSIRVAIVLIMVGAGGQAIGFASGAWDHYLDTLLYGGILSLLIANRRAPSCMPAGLSNRLALWSCGSAITLVGLYVVFRP